MKKILLFASALAGLFLAGSCQRENLEPMESANTVTYTVQLPGALSTKTIGEKDADVAAVKELVYEVYRTEATSADDFTGADRLLYHKTATAQSDGTFKINLELVNDQNFRVLFWAQVPGNDVYTVDNLKNVTISKTLNANAENYAAFAGADYIEAGESIVDRTIQLVRPIAQLNIGTDDASLDIEDHQTDVVISTTAVTVNGLSTTFNVAENKAGEISDADYVYKAMPVAPTAEYPGLSESTFAVNGINYNYVAMNYVGFAPQMGTNVKVTYTINTENVGTIENTIDNVPVKANHRTNIVGNLITSMSDYTITLDEKWAGEFISASNATEFADALANAQSGDIVNVAEGNFELPASLFANATEGTFTIAGSGAATVMNGAVNANAEHPGNYAHGKHLVFKDLTYVTPNNGYNGGFGHAASVTFINCTIVGQFYAHSEAPHYFYDCKIDPLTGYLYTYASDCVFEGCTFNASEGKALQVYEDGAVGENTVTIKDCDFVAAKQAQTWDGKPVTGIDINSNGAIFNVYVENCTTTGFPVGLNSGSALYNIKDGGLAYTYLTVDGVVVNRPGFTKLANYPNIWVKDNNYYVFDKAGLAELNTYFKANWCSNDVWNHEYHIGANIDAEGLTWNSAWVNVGDNGLDGLVFDGDNHTISNLKINGSLFGGTPNGGNAGTAPGYVKDITIDNATVTGDHWTAIFWGDSYGEIVYDNVTVKNTSVTGNCNVAIFLAGTVIEGAGSIDNILFKNCKVENCSVVANGKADQDPTGASGFVGRTYGKTSLKFEGENTIDEATTITNNNGLVGGRVYAYTVHIGGNWEGTGTCDTFTNWDGLDFVLVSDGLLKKKNTPEYYVSSAAGLEKMNQMFSDKSAGKNVVLNLTKDIDFTGKTWTPVDSHADAAFQIAEINGNGHTISNLTINGQAMFTRFAGTGDVVVKNITFDNATVNSNGSINTSILVGHTYQNVLLDNVDVKNSTITGGYKVAPLIATVYNESTSTITATLNNCDVENTTVKATSYDFCTTGMVAFVYAGDNDQVAFENCTVSDVKLYAPNVYTAHAAIYTTGSETLFNEAEGVTVNNVTFENI